MITSTDINVHLVVPFRAGTAEGAELLPDIFSVEGHVARSSPARRVDSVLRLPEASHPRARGSPSRRMDRLQRLTMEIGGLPVECDLLAPEGVESLVAAVVERLGPPEILVNVAAGAGRC